MQWKIHKILFMLITSPDNDCNLPSHYLCPWISFIHSRGIFWEPTLSQAHVSIGGKLGELAPRGSKEHQLSLNRVGSKSHRHVPDAHTARCQGWTGKRPVPSLHSAIPLPGNLHLQLGFPVAVICERTKKTDFSKSKHMLYCLIPLSLVSMNKNKDLKTMKLNNKQLMRWQQRAPRERWITCSK